MHTRFLLIDKQVDWTSNDVTVYIRNKVSKHIKQENPHIKHVRVGHAGTLDPFATGLLIVGVGRQSTRQLDEFKQLPKTYEAILQLGATSDTFDRTGKIEESGTGNVGHLPASKAKLTEKQILETLQSFTGNQQQIPPMHSAKKVDGKRLYKLARKGVEVERKPHDITIYDIHMIEINNHILKIRCSVSPGTYIRTLAHDIGKKLKVGAYCTELRRTKIGNFSVEDAIDVKSITDENWQTYVIEL